MASSVVYFIQMQNSKGPIKIGVAEDARFRLSDLQVGNPHKLRLLGSCPGDRRLEATIHKRLKNWRIRGEWFQPTIEVVDEIAKHISFAPADDPKFRTHIGLGQPEWEVRCMNCNYFIRADYERKAKPQMCKACEEFAAMRAKGEDPFD